MMSADNTTKLEDGTFPTGSVERVLDEFRGTNDAVEALFRVHRGQEDSSALDREIVEEAIAALNETVALALEHGNQHVEFLHYTEDGWYSLTTTSVREVGPIPLYDHNINERLGEYPVRAVRTASSPFADVDLPRHDLDEREVNLDV